MNIKDVLSISPQNTYGDSDYLNNAVLYFGNKLSAIEPDYSGIIPPNQLRRMGKAIRLGLGCGIPLLIKHGNVDGIIIGTSDGGLEDCIKFLNQIVDYDEGSLTPTNFIQSTPNAVSGQLALLTGNTNYNITHVNKGLAFENALIDAKMFFKENETKTLLVGNIEEISNYNYNIENSADQFKKTECCSNELFQSNTNGTVCGEGSVMFVLDNLESPGGVCIKDVATITYPDKNDIYLLVSEVLKTNNLEIKDIDCLIVGLNGDIRSDVWYYDVLDKFFKEQTIVTFKNLVGEYPTSSAFALKLAHDLFFNNVISGDIIFRRSKRKIKNILIYNHYKGVQHSLILVSKSKI